VSPPDPLPATSETPGRGSAEATDRVLEAAVPALEGLGVLQSVRALDDELTRRSGSPRPNAKPKGGDELLFFDLRTRFRSAVRHASDKAISFKKDGYSDFQEGLSLGAAHGVVVHGSFPGVRSAFVMWSDDGRRKVRECVERFWKKTKDLENLCKVREVQES
jgi:hypothetical protein